MTLQMPGMKSLGLLKALGNRCLQLRLELGDWQTGTDAQPVEMKILLIVKVFDKILLLSSINLLQQKIF